MDANALLASGHAGLDLSLDDLIKAGAAAGKPRGAGHGAGGRGFRGGGRPGGGRGFGGGYAQPRAGTSFNAPPPARGAPPPAHRPPPPPPPPRRSVLSRLGPPGGRGAAHGAAEAPPPSGGHPLPERLVLRPDGSLALRLRSSAPGAPAWCSVLAVAPDGSARLWNGDGSPAAQAALSGALQVLGFVLKGHAATGWWVSDGAKLLRRFAEGMTLPPPGAAAGPPRSLLLRRAYGEPVAEEEAGGWAGGEGGAAAAARPAARYRPY